MESNETETKQMTKRKSSSAFLYVKNIKYYLVFFLVLNKFLSFANKLKVGEKT